jgi:hypothetical protein
MATVSSPVRTGGVKKVLVWRGEGTGSVSFDVGESSMSLRAE